MPSFDDGGQTSTAGDGTALRAHAVPVATRTHDRRRAHQGDEVARLRHRRAGVETGVGCAALGTATGQGSPAGPRPVRPRIRTARHRVPDLPPRDGIACRSETLVARRYAAVGLLVARYADKFEYIPKALPASQPSAANCPQAAAISRP